MCQPSKWWWGLVPLAMLWIGASAFMTPLIESELSHRARSALVQNGPVPSSVKLAIEGRDVVLEGSAASEQQRHNLVLGALEIEGVRLVVNNLKAIPETKPVVWQAMREAKTLTMSGQVAGGRARQEIIAAAKKAMPSLVVHDQMIDAPEASRVTLATTVIALGQLAKLKTGSVVLAGNVLSIKGAAIDEATAVAVTVAAAQLQPPVQVGAIEVSGPVTPVKLATTQQLSAARTIAKAKPYVWTATKAGDVVNLTGSAPSDASRSLVIANAKGESGKVRVIDQLKIADGLPASVDYAQATAFAAKQLANLRSGSVTISDGALAIEGEAVDAPAFQSLPAAVAGDLPGGLKLDRLSIVPPRVANYKWSARREGKTLTLSGYYPDEATRQAMLIAITQRFADFTIKDSTAIASGAPAGFAPAMGMGLDQLARLESGEALIVGRRFTLSGVAASAKVAAEAKVALGKLVGGMPAEAKLTVAAPSPPAPTPATAKPAPLSSNVPPAALSSPTSAMTMPPAANAPATTAGSAIPAATLGGSSVPPLTTALSTEACSAELAAAAKTGTIAFASSKALVLTASDGLIGRVVKAMKRCPAVKIEIAGHTDRTGSVGFNETLSKARAEVIRKLLVRRGVDAARVTAIGYGAARPVADNETPAGKARNRRIEFAMAQ